MSDRQACQHETACPTPKPRKRYYGKLWICPTCHTAWTLDRACMEGCAYWWVRWTPPPHPDELAEGSDR